MRKDWNIKSQIALMVAAISIIIAGIEIGIILNSMATNRVNVQRELDNSTLHIDNNVSLFCSEVESTVDNLYYSPKLQNFFTETDPMERYVISQYIQDIINATIYGNLNISTIKILQSNYMISAAGSNSQQATFYKANLDYGLFDLIPKEAFYTRMYMDEATNKPYVAYVRPVFPVDRFASMEDKTQKKMFYVLYRLDSLQQYVDSIVSTLPNTEIVIEDNGTIILSNNHYLINNSLNTSAFFQNKKKYQTMQRKLEIRNWNVYISVPISEIYQNSFSMLKENLAVAGLSIMIIVGLGFWIAQNLTYPVTKLSRDINSIYGEDDSEHTLGTYDLVEINDIAIYINSMLDRIRNTNESLMEVQDHLHQSVIAKKEMELLFYQTQINPHFLYNTLECMRSIGQAYNVPEIQTISNSMAKIFRYSIKKGDIVDFSEELACANDYFEIIKIRFLNKFVLKIDVSEDLLPLKIPKMVLQPLAENAIGHGLNDKQDGGLVQITATRDDMHFYIYVSDDGQGIDPQRLEDLNHYLQSSWRRRANQEKRYGVALDNINRRIKLDFGEEYGISLLSILENGTQVKITLPIIRET